MASFPYLLLGSDSNISKSMASTSTSSSPSTSTSSFSIDTLLSPQLSIPSLQSIDNFQLAANFPWHVQAAAYPFVAMLNPLLPQFMPPYQNFGTRRKRRHRTIFSEEQLGILESTFMITPYPDVSTREKLAIQCALKEERVEVWFKNRRAKEKKQKRDDGDHKLSGDSECDESDDDIRKCKKIKKSEKESSSPEAKISNSSNS